MYPIKANDKDAIVSIDDTEVPNTEITKLAWCVPHITESFGEQI